MNKIIFSGLLILVCCLFGEIGISEAKDKYDISGECIKMDISTGTSVISPNDICMAKGYGKCLKASGSFETCTTDSCDTCSGAIAGATCDGKNWWNIVAADTSAAKVGHLICKPKTW